MGTSTTNGDFHGNNHRDGGLLMRKSSVNGGHFSGCSSKPFSMAEACLAKRPCIKLASSRNWA